MLFVCLLCCRGCTAIGAVVGVASVILSVGTGPDASHDWSEGNTIVADTSEAAGCDMAFVCATDE